MFFLGPFALLVVALGAFYIAGSIFTDRLLRQKTISLAVAIAAMVVGIALCCVLVAGLTGLL